MDIEDIKRAASLIKEAEGILAKGPLNYYLEEMAASYEMLMKRYAPFKVGDRVALSVTPNITRETACGWMGSKHFLKKASQGRVVTAECGLSGFTFGVEFDDETWIDAEGKRRLPQHKHSFHFGETKLCHVPQAMDTSTDVDRATIE